MFKYNNAGFSTLEILIAMSIIVASISAVVLVVFGNQSLVLDSQMNSEALQIVGGMTAEARVHANANFNVLQSVATTSDGMYEKSVTVTSLDEFKKQVIGTVSWYTHSGSLQQVVLNTLVTDWRNALSGNTCNAPLVGDWHHPVMTSYMYGADLLKNNATITPISDMQERGNKLYVGLSTSATRSDPKFFIFDIFLD